MKRVHSLLTSILLAAGAIACGSAQVHMQDQSGGVLVLKGDRGKAMEDAHAQMSMHCGPGAYQITKQERVVVGSQSTTNNFSETEGAREREQQTDAQVDSQSGSDRYGNYSSTDASAQERERERYGETTQGQSRTVNTDVHEFRLHYACTAGGAPAAPLPQG